MVPNGINRGTAAAMIDRDIPANGDDAVGDLPAAPVAYPRYIVRDGLPTGEKPLSSAFFENNPSHLIGRRTGTGVWPDDPEDAEAVALFEAGQKALYEEKDVVKAIRSYEAALEREPAYIKAWVALSIAYISDNTPESLDRAEEALTYLAGIEPNEWLTVEVSGIVHQNRAYLYLHRYRMGGSRDRGLLEMADADYAVADARSAGRPRIEHLCPWAYVKIELGDLQAARTLWDRARAYADATGAAHLLREYAAKYVPLRRFLGN
jgi:tetratricopeptide (TPR) repeat protein